MFHFVYAQGLILFMQNPLHDTFCRLIPSLAPHSSHTSSLLFYSEWKSLQKVMRHYQTSGFTGFLSDYCWYQTMFFAFHTDLQQIFWCSVQEPGRCWEDSKDPAWGEASTFLGSSALPPFPVEILNKCGVSLISVNQFSVNSTGFRICLLSSTLPC